MSAFLEAARRFAAACDSAGIPYFLGGSAATSLYGEPRQTNDLDFVVDPKPQQMAHLARLLGPDFEIDLDALERAARWRKTANIFFVPPGEFIKIDIFFREDSPFDRSEFGRRQRLQVDSTSLWVKTPEDSVIRKLDWFRQGGAELDKQWRDVVMVLAVNGERLDHAYLDEWALKLGLSALLARARAAEPRPT